MSLFKLLGLTSEEPVSTNDTETMRRIVAELDQIDEARARYLAAFAYILGRVAHADSSFSEEETEKMCEAVHGLGHISEAQAVLVVEIAKNQVKLFGSTENFLVVRQFKELATSEQCVELLDCVFAVSAADASITVLEEGQAGQIAKELGMSHDDFIAARVTYKEHLETLKKLKQNG